MNFILEFILVDVLRQDFNIVYVLEKMGNHRKILYRDLIQPLKKTFKFGEDTYNIDLGNCTYGKYNLPILFYEKGTPSPIAFVKPDTKLTSKSLTILLEDDTINDVLKTSNKEYTFMIIGLVIIILAVIGFAFYTVNNLNQQIIELQKQIGRIGV